MNICSYNHTNCGGLTLTAEAFDIQVGILHFKQGASIVVDPQH